jgi:hypothetical protein
MEERSKMAKVKDSGEYNDLYRKMVEKYEDGKNLIKYGKVGTAIVTAGSLYEFYKHHIGAGIAIGTGAAVVGGLLCLVNKKVKNLEVMTGLFNESSFTNMEGKK